MHLSAKTQPLFTYVMTRGEANELSAKTGAVCPETTNDLMMSLRKLENVIAVLPHHCTGFRIPNAYHLAFSDSCPDEGPLRAQGEMRVKPADKVEWHNLTLQMEEGMPLSIDVMLIESIAFKEVMISEIEIITSETERRSPTETELKAIRHHPDFPGALQRSIDESRIPVTFAEIDGPDGESLLAMCRIVDNVTKLVAAQKTGPMFMYNLTAEEVSGLRHNLEFMERLHDICHQDDPEEGPQP